MKKIMFFSLTILTLVSINYVSAFTFKVNNGLNKKVCVELNASNQKISKSIEPGKQAVFTFTGWMKGLALKSITVNSFKEGCKGVSQLGKANMFSLDKTKFNQLKLAVTEAYATKKVQDQKKQNLTKQINNATTSVVSISEVKKDSEFILIQKNGKYYAASEQ